MVYFYLQSLAQLDNLYGKDVSQIIQDNCGLAYLKTNTQSTAEEISKHLGTHGVETSSISHSISLINDSGSKNTSLMSRGLMTPDEIKQLHYKTIILPTVGYPILRNTVTYDKFSCYKKGAIEREKRPLDRLIDTYYTVESIKTTSNNSLSKVATKEVKTNKIDPDIKKKLEIIINEVLKIFNNVDYEVEYLNIQNVNYAYLYLSSIMSNSDIFELNNLSINMNFCFNIISSSEKIHRQNRNSKIEINITDNN